MSLWMVIDLVVLLAALWLLWLVGSRRLRRRLARRRLRQRLDLIYRDGQAFAEAMLNPEAPNERLRTLAKKPGFRSKGYSA